MGPRPDRWSCSRCLRCTSALYGSSGRWPVLCAGWPGTWRQSAGRRRPWLPNLTLAAIAALCGAVWVLGLWYLGLYNHPAVRSWQRLARLRGLAVRRPWGERMGARLPLLRRAQEETDIERLLAIAGRDDSATAWLLRVAFQAGLALVTVLLLDELALLLGQRPALPGGSAGLCPSRSASSSSSSTVTRASPAWNATRSSQAVALSSRPAMASKRSMSVSSWARRRSGSRAPMRSPNGRRTARPRRRASRCQLRTAGWL